MGGFGSGTYLRWSSKATTGESKAFDIRALKKWGALKAGYAGSYSWSRGNEPIGDIRYRVGHSEITLNYRVRMYEEDWETVEQYIPLTSTGCNYGGQRPWFICHCGKRVAILYAGGKYFRCRHCYDLAYNSQQEALYDRMVRKCRKIRERLRADEDLDYPIWRKPKGMHQTTFDKLLKKERIAQRYIQQRNDYFFGILNGL